MSTRTHFVYRVYDEFGLLLYVGCTKGPEARYKQHRGDKAPWLPYMATARLEGPYVKANGFAQEKSVIATEEPYFNSLPEHMAHNAKRRKVQKRLMAETRVMKSELFARIREAYDPEVHTEFHRLCQEVEAMADAEFAPEMGGEYRLNKYLSARRREAVSCA